jgi:hypothetical protein
MKKLCIIALTAVFCMGFALPAMADLNFSGAITFDLWRMSYDEDAGDRDTTQFEIYTPINYLAASYTNSDKNLGGRFTVYMGRVNDEAWTYDGGQNYIWWKPQPKLRITIGNQNQIVGGHVGPPSHLKGSDIIVLITYGNLHTSTKLGITGDYKINDMVSLKVGLYDPDDDGTVPITLPAAAGATVIDETSLPRIDFGLPIKYKLAGTDLSVMPKASFLTKSFKNVAAGSDDSYTITTFGFDGRVKFGPVTGMFEFHLASNIAGGNYTGGWTGPLTYLDASGNTNIADTDTTLWWLGVNYAFNPRMGIDVFYASLEDTNDGGATALDDYERTRSSYGLRFKYAILANFLIYPHLQFYDYGDTTVGGAATDNGSATQIGANLWLAF